MSGLEVATMIWPFFPAAALAHLACILITDKGDDGEEKDYNDEMTLLAYSWSTDDSTIMTDKRSATDDDSTNMTDNHSTTDDDSMIVKDNDNTTDDDSMIGMDNNSIKRSTDDDSMIMTDNYSTIAVTSVYYAASWVDAR